MKKAIHLGQGKLTYTKVSYMLNICGGMNTYRKFKHDKDDTGHQLGDFYIRPTEFTWEFFVVSSFLDSQDLSF